MAPQRVSPAASGVADRLLALLESAGAEDASAPNACQLAARHGLAGLLNVARLGGADSSLGRAEYLANFAANRRIIPQLAEIARAFHAAGVPFVVLKGCAALLLGLYESIGCREIGDLDLLVPDRSLAQARRILETLGYSAAPSEFLSPLDELVAFHSGHAAPYSQAGRLPVELHGSILYGRGRNARFAEIWQRSVPADCDGVEVRCPCAAHFLIHAAIHLRKHLESRKHPSKLKDVADALLLVQPFESQLEWPEFWRTAARWRVVRDAASFAATLNRVGGLAIPLPAPFSSADAIPGRVLLLGSDGPPPPPGSRTGYLHRLNTARVLPGFAQRIRYYFRLAIPAPAVLRERHGVRSGMTSLYIRRFSALSSHLFKIALGYASKTRQGAGARAELRN